MIDLKENAGFFSREREFFYLVAVLQEFVRDDGSVHKNWVRKSVFLRLYITSDFLGFIRNGQIKMHLAGFIAPAYESGVFRICGNGRQRRKAVYQKKRL